MTCPNCTGEGCTFCRPDHTIPTVAPETLGYIQERTGITADNVPSAIGKLVHEIVRLQCALGAMQEQRDIYRNAVYQNARSALLVEDAI